MLISMAPNLLPLAIMFAVMGISGINLDLATATVASIALGVAVDDTIHFLFHYQKERKAVRNYSEAIIETHDKIGRIIVISSVILCVGYAILLLASLKTAVYLGLLTLISVIGAIIGDLILLPQLLKSAEPKTHE